MSKITLLQSTTVNKVPACPRMNNLGNVSRRIFRTFKVVHFRTSSILLSNIVLFTRSQADADVGDVCPKFGSFLGPQKFLSRDSCPNGCPKFVEP